MKRTDKNGLNTTDNHGRTDYLVLFLTFFCLLSFTLGQIGRLSLFNQEINGYIYEFFAVLLLIILVIRRGLLPIYEYQKKFRFVFIFLGFLIATFIPRISYFSVFENVASFLYLLRLVFYFLAFIYVLYENKENRHNKTDKTNRNGNIFLNISAGFIIFFSLLQYFLYPNFRNLSYLGWDPHWYRLVGTFFEPPVAGAIFGLFFLYYFFQAEFFKTYAYIRYVLMGIFMVFMFFTYSRTTYLAFLFTVILYLLNQKLGKIVVPLIIGFFALLFLLPRPFGESVNLLRVFSIESRLSDDAQAIQTWQKSALAGIGYNRIRYVKNVDNKTSHAASGYSSSFIIILVTGGIIGLIAFILSLIELGVQSQFALYGIVFLSIASLTDNVLLHPFVLFLFLLTSAVTGEDRLKKI